MTKEKSIKAIFPAVKRVFKNMFQREVTKGKVKFNNKIITDTVTISIGVTGDLQGNIFFSFSEQMSLDLVEDMAGMEVNELDKFVTSAIGELANIISGHTATALNEEGYQCDIVPPQVIKGDNQIISTEQKEIILLPIDTNKYQFTINISLKNN